MRVPRLTVPAIAALCVASLSACERPPQRAAADTPRGVTITKSGDPAPPKVQPSSGGKLAVMDQPPVAAPAAARPKPASPPTSQPIDDPRYDPGADPQGRADYDPRYDGDPEFEDAAPTRRDCRRAERREDPLADTRACRQLLAEARPQPSDPGLVADCIEAARIDDPFADSRVCRRVLDR